MRQTVMQKKSGFKKPIEVPMLGDYLQHNKMVGGIRFHQEVAERTIEQCIFPSGLKEEMQLWFGKPCSKFSKNPMHLMPEYQHAETFGEPARVDWILLGANDIEHVN